MAATIITISKVNASGTNVQIKVNDGHPVPSQIVADSIQSFKTWIRDKDHIFVWTDNLGHERSMIVPFESIGWILSSKSFDAEDRRFCIDAPCSVVVEAESPPV